jgi:hypothetical protein
MLECPLDRFVLLTCEHHRVIAELYGWEATNVLQSELVKPVQHLADGVQSFVRNPEVIIECRQGIITVPLDKPLRCARKQPAAPEDAPVQDLAAEKPSYASARFAREEPKGVVKADEDLTTWAEYATQLHETTEGIRGMV